MEKFFLCPPKQAHTLLSRVVNDLEWFVSIHCGLLIHFAMGRDSLWRESPPEPQWLADKEPPCHECISHSLVLHLKDAAAVTQVIRQRHLATCLHGEEKRTAKAHSLAFFSWAAKGGEPPPQLRVTDHRSLKGSSLNKWCERLTR